MTDAKCNFLNLFVKVLLFFSLSASKFILGTNKHSFNINIRKTNTDIIKLTITLTSIENIIHKKLNAHP